MQPRRVAIERELEHLHERGNDAHKRNEAQKAEVETGEARRVHDFCLLAGYGAEAINPYLALDSITHMLPEIDTDFRELDSRLKLRIEQHKMLVKRRDDLLTTPRPEFLATREEQAMLRKIEAIEKALEDGTITDEGYLGERMQRLKGLLIWTLETEYHERLSQFDQNLRSLADAMLVAEEQ